MSEKGRNRKGVGIVLALVMMGMLFVSSVVATPSSGDVWTWGWNTYGQLGDGTTIQRLAPVQVKGLTDVIKIVGAGDHTIALKSDGTVWTWGNNIYGQLGDGTTINALIPVQVRSLTGVIDIAGGGYHTIVLKSDGTVWAWGYNMWGQLGDGTTINKWTPVQVSGLTGVIRIASGNAHNFALKSDGTVWAWGSNSVGQLGNGMVATMELTPVQVSGLTNVIDITGGDSHTLALKSDGTVWAWGNNANGQLGNGTRINKMIPVQVSSLTGVIDIAAGVYHSASLKSDGTVWAWGWNAYGQLGDGTTLDRLTPVQVSSLAGVIDIAAGVYHSASLKSDGTVWAWGSNYAGQLGNSTVVIKTVTPVQVDGLINVIEISGGNLYTIAIVSNSFTPTPTPIPTASPTPTPSPTLTPEPLTASIISPSNNFYSEESVSFKGIASGGVPPYTYTWTSNRIAETLGNTEEFSTKLAFNNETQEMNKHTITLSVKDSTGNSAPVQTVELNVVVQKVKVLVVPVIKTGGEVSLEDRDRMDSLINSATDYYKKSSYGAVYLDFTEGPTISSDVLFPIAGDEKSENLGRWHKRILDDAIVKLNMPPYTVSPYSDNLALSDIVILADTENIVPAVTYELGGTTSPRTAIIVNIGKNARLGEWVHEKGHALGNVVLTSELNTEPYKSRATPSGTQRLLWGGAADDCNDLYSCGSVYAWDVMATGDSVYNSIGDSRISQPTDMSVLSKTKLGWLKKKTIIGGPGSFFITSTESMHYGDNAATYKTNPFSNVEYYIEAREVAQPSFYRMVAEDDPADIRWPSLNNGILIYKVINEPSGHSVNVLRNIAPFAGDEDFVGPSFLASDGTSASYNDCAEFVRFSVFASYPERPYRATVQIDEPGFWCSALKGGILIGEKIASKATSGSFSSGENMSTVPHLSLHAVTPSGLHIGTNHTSGLYDMQIPGGVSSGDTIGEQWIFVPTGTPVSYYVDSYDVEQYLLENPGLDPANFSVNYSTTLMEYGENPRRVELSDGNWTVTNRTVSTPKESIIQPGTTNEVLVYNFSGFLGKINSNGSSLFNQKSSIPVIFQLRYANGSFVTDAVATISVFEINNILVGTEMETISTNQATVGNQFNFDAQTNQYIFVLSAKTLKPGYTYRVVINLPDGTTRSVDIGIK